MIKRVDRMGSFTAYDDSGNSYVLEIYADVIDAGTMDDPNAEHFGVHKILTADGSHVNRVSKGSYQIVSSGLNLKSDDPSAP